MKNQTMKNQITEDNLRLGLDAPYNKESNKIDVYSSVYWTAENEEEYIEKEDIINNYKIENELFTLYSWCDVSGFDYWVIQLEEENYVSIDVVLKKDVLDYTEKEIETIKTAIWNADNFFQMELL
jgi:hypothetical protein